MPHKLVGLLVAMGLASTALADDVEVDSKPPYCGYRGHCPLVVAPWAKLSKTPDYMGYYVGGGATWRHGEPRCLEEGTWGWDYSGRCFTRRVWLNWYHGLKYQAGSGNYKTDGPNIKHSVHEKLEKSRE